jgi:hypothetical protein
MINIEIKIDEKTNIMISSVLSERVANTPKIV